MKKFQNIIYIFNIILPGKMHSYKTCHSYTSYLILYFYCMVEAIEGDTI
jgi:hypothetical protein